MYNPHTLYCKQEDLNLDIYNIIAEYFSQPIQLRYLHDLILSLLWSEYLAA